MLFWHRFCRVIVLFMRGGIVGLFHRLMMCFGLRGTVSAPSFPFNQQFWANKLYETKLHSNEPGTKDLPLPALVFSHNLNREGASISLFELIVALTARGEIAPSLISFEDGPLRAEYEAAGIQVSVHSPVLGRLSTVRRLDAAVSDLVDTIHQHHPGLVFANTLLCFPAILAAEQAGIPSIWTPRESEPWNTYFGFLPDAVAQRAIAAIWLPFRVVFVAHATRKVWQKLDLRGNFEVIHNGINLNRFPNRGDAAERTRCRNILDLEVNAIVIVCVGTLCDRKGQKDLIEAVALLPETIADRVQIFLVGDDHGTYANALRHKCGLLPLNISRRIRFFPHTENIECFYAAADIFVLSSKVESFPRVVLEAMAFGLPIITTPVYGVLEQVTEGENALFYSPGDSRELAKQIELLASDETLRGRMSLSSLQRIAHMTTYDEMADAYANICKHASSCAMRDLHKET